MGRPNNNSGHWTVENAEQLFIKSVADGKPDFRLVALAIGAAPISPPRWAIYACIEEKEREQRKPPTSSFYVSSSEIDKVLNKLIRHLYDRQEERETNPVTMNDLPPPIRSSLIKTLELLNLPVEEGANDDWLRPYRRAWEHEQAQDACWSAHRLEGYVMTFRIDRELQAYMGELVGYPPDPVQALWHLNNPKSD